MKGRSKHSAPSEIANRNDNDDPGMRTVTMTLTCIGLALPRRKATYKPRGHYSSKAKAHPGTLPPRA